MNLKHMIKDILSYCHNQLKTIAKMIVASVSTETCTTPEPLLGVDVVDIVGVVFVVGVVGVVSFVGVVGAVDVVSVASLLHLKLYGVVKSF